MKFIAILSTLKDSSWLLEMIDRGSFDVLASVFMRITELDCWSLLSIGHCMSAKCLSTKGWVAFSVFFCLPTITSCFLEVLLPPLFVNLGVSHFIRYLHSFRHIPCRMERLYDTFIIRESVWQIVYNIMQVNISLNLQFSFSSTWIRK
jgi:hypothetical protein